jgi:hypothetical protein
MIVYNSFLCPCFLPEGRQRKAKRLRFHLLFLVASSFSYLHRGKKAIFCSVSCWLREEEKLCPILSV